MAEIVVALDFASEAEALGFVDRVGSGADFYKVGLELFTRAGPRVVERLRERGKRVFLDLKLHDIPNTVGRTVSVARGLGVELLTVHASGGEAMLRAAQESAAGEVQLLGVTLLTSLTLREVSGVWGREPADLALEVVRLGALVQQCGLAGVVASPHEARALRDALGATLLIVTPGIRLPGGAAHDQSRIATPEAAVEAGASHLVVGRAVTEADDPVSTLSRIRAAVAAS